MPSIQNFYDRVGSLYDWAERFEGRAKSVAFEQLSLTKGNCVLNVGAGTGIDHARLARQIGSTGMAAALDLSTVMLRLVRERTHQPIVRADARTLPFRDQSFDCVFCSYVLDLIPTQELRATVHEFQRVLRPGGQIALVTMTNGTTRTSKELIRIWTSLYRLSPIVCGGCRPVELLPLLQQEEFRQIRRSVVVEAGFPSQIIIANR